MKKLSSMRWALCMLLTGLWLLRSETGKAAGSLFTLNGNNSPLAQSDSCVRLTNGGLNVFGSMWYKKKADLSHDFYIAATLYFGTSGMLNGADGITFAFQNQCVSAGNTGADLGIGGVNPSLIVQFDTYPDNAIHGINYGDPNPYYDFIAIHKNGVLNFNQPANTLVGPVSMTNPPVDVTQGQSWPVAIRWTAGDTTLRVYFNHVLRATYQGDIVKNIFSNNPYVYWGFTAGSGGLGNVQSVCLDTLPSNAVQVTNFAICAGQSHQVSLPGYNTYKWSPATGVSDTTVFNPVLSPSSTTTYRVSLTDACNNVTVDSVKVTVNPLPATQLTLPFQQRCTGQSAIALSGGSPAGGVYSGAGVSGGQFSAATAGAGLQTIRYTYTNGFGCSASDSDAVLVNADPTVSLASINPLCVNASPVALSGGSPAGGVYSGVGVSGGNFDPSVAGAGNVVITYTYTNAGTGCSGSATRTVTVNPLPAAAINTPSGTVLCSGSPIALQVNAVSGTAYQWKQGGVAVTTSDAANTSYSASAAGSYTLVATSSSGCVNTSTPVVITTGINPNPSISSADTAFCSGGAMLISSNLGAGETIKWYRNNTLIAGAVGSSYTATQGGNYQAVVTSSTGCNASSNTVKLTMNAGVTASVTSSTSTFCAGTSSIVLNANVIAGATYQWLNGSGMLNGANTSSYAAASAGDYRVVVVSPAGCRDTSSVITLTNGSAPVAILSTADTNFCSGTGLLTVTATSGAGYAWSVNGSATAGSGNTLVPSQGGTYQVTVTSQQHCTAVSNAITMVQQQAPTAAISASSTSVCAGSSVLLTAAAVNGATYEWKRNGTSLGAPSSVNTYSATQSGTYVCVVSKNCSATSNAVVITVSSGPAAPSFISGTGTQCPGGFDLFTINPVAGATSYTWSISPANGASLHSGQGTDSILITFNNQNVVISVTANNACGSSSATSKAISISSIPFCNGTEVAFSATPSNTCTGSTVVFTNYSDQASVGGLFPVWNFGAGASPATSTASGPVSVTYSTAGLKDVSLIYNDASGNLVTGFGWNAYINVSGSVNTSAITGTATLPNCNGNVADYSVVNTSGSTYQWNVQGGNISAGQGSSHITANFPGSGGVVSVTETTAGGCVGAPVQLQVNCSGPNGITDAMGATFRVQPNPAEGAFYINGTTATAGTVSISIYGADMREVHTTASELGAGNFSIPFASDLLPKGIYLVQVRMNQTSRTEKLVVQ